MMATQSSSGVRLTIQLPTDDVIYGESLLLLLTMSNTGTTAATLPDGPLAPIAFALRSRDNGRIYEHSLAKRAIDAQMGKPAEPIPQRETTLAAGESRDSTQDPADYALERTLPSRYEMKARFTLPTETIESNALDVTIRPARIRTLRSAYCQYTDAFVTMFDHQREDGAVWLYQQDSRGRRPDKGVYYRRAPVSTAHSDLEFATCVHLAPRIEGRWGAWLERDRCRAVRAGGPHVTGRAEGPPLALADARLLNPGFQPDRESAWILAAGRSRNGTAIQSMRIAGTSIVAGPVVPLGAAENWRHLRARCVNGESRRTHLVWAEPRAQGTAIYRRTFSAEAQPLEPQPVMLYETPRRVLALELSPLGTDSGTVHALFAAPDTSRHGDPLLFCSIAVNSQPGVPAEEWSLAPPADSVRTWAITGEITRGLIVLAESDGRVLFGTAYAPTPWRELARDVSAMHGLQLAATRPATWAALYTDARTGLESRYNPDATL